MKRKRQNPLSLSHLQVLLAVAEYSSFSEAALQLDMSQSAVSNAIATLEADLGVVLLSRGRYGAMLTPVGERIVAHAEQMMKLQDEMFKDANLSRSLKGGQVRISSFRSVSTHVLPDVIAQFQQRFPDVDIKLIDNLDHPSIEEDLRKGRADIGFTDQFLGDEFETWELMRDEYVALLPPSFQPRGHTVTWEELTAYPMIMASEDDFCDRLVFAHCATHGITLHVAYHVSTDSTIVSMVARGLGATIIPRLAAEPIPLAVKVFSLPVPLFRTISIVMMANTLQSPPVFALLDLLKESSRLLSGQK